jgi:hypothetical protein
MLAISIAMRMRRCDAGHIAQWSTSRASIEATGCRHWESARVAKNSSMVRYDMAVSIFLIHCFLDNVWVLLNLFELPREIISILLRNGSSEVDLGPARQPSNRIRSMHEAFRRDVVSYYLDVFDLAVERWCFLITVVMMLMSIVNSEIPSTI